MTASRLLTLVTLVCVLAFSGSAFPDQTSRTAPILKKLASTLKLVEEDKIKNVDDVMKIPLKQLLGLAKRDIVDALGESDECDADDVQSGGGCTRVGDLVYSFYTMCDSCLGGGPELSMSFDDSGKCERAQWIVTE